MVSDSFERTAVVVEDDSDIRELLALTLSMVGFNIIETASGKEALALVREHQPDLITLDLNLPDLDGMEVCRQLRPMTDAYIVMVTARVEEIERVLGLEIGADDFIVKPFSPREVRARVAAMFRRPRNLAESSAGPATDSSTTGGASASASSVAAGSPASPSAASSVAGASAAGHPDGGGAVVVHGALSVDIEGRVAWLDGEELALTKIEFDLLATLITGPRRVWTRESLLARVWGEGWTDDHHLVEVHIRNLRKKLGEDTREPRFIRTVRGVGYRLVPVT
ncbi:DNA-binding response OmpR family regulator [Arthrobacter pigmenti]|uniref:DNA-binding response OmpR family regulator n=1 Tax=Arthrobacter pigmenti TaxID=271432 RepID=A0A846RVG9_9MICC|nr:response regulator transcription factor [Arthrobacter pigmenti]NJC23605.1 DNA-binding response OmpR family regulator [Arthrobacter pigmenti]